RAVVVVDAADQAEIETAHQHALARKLDPWRWLDVVEEDEGKVIPVVVGDGFDVVRTIPHGTSPYFSGTADRILRDMIVPPPFWRVHSRHGEAVAADRSSLCRIVARKASAGLPLPFQPDFPTSFPR